MELGPIQKQWIRNLREHPERQASAFLGYVKGNDIKMCCLGQLLYCVKGDSCLNEEGRIKDGPVHKASLVSSYEELGLRDGLGSSVVGRNLSELNDFYKTWPEIADIVEKDPSNYFTKSY